MSGYGQAPFGSYPYAQAGVESNLLNWQPRFDIGIDRLSPVTFELTNESWALRDVVVRAKSSLDQYEVAYSDAAGFSGPFRRGSSRVAIPNGYRFVLRRTGGWIGARVSIEASATDLAGAELSGQSS